MGAQGPGEENGSPSSEQDSNSGPFLQITGTGWKKTGLLPATPDVSMLALTPVNCTLMSSPIVGIEISKGQNPNDITNFTNDLMANGFSLGRDTTFACILQIDISI